MISLVLGGTRSGKSLVAERLAATFGTVTYVATGVVTDPAMAARIAAHRVRRPESWATVEAPGPNLLEALADARGAVLVDSIGTWVAGYPDLAADIDGLCTALAARSAPTVVVSEEVGMSVHPPTELGRRFVDVVGETNRRVGQLATEVLLVVAGRVLPLPSLEEWLEGEC